MSILMSGGEVQALVQRVERRGKSIIMLRLRVLEAPFTYVEGQYLSISLPGTDERRSYSMASPCRLDGEIDLHIRLHEGGSFSGMLRDQIRAGSLLTLSGPYGNCVWTVPKADPAMVILLATGTGIAPLKAMIERHLPDGEENDVWLYWSAENPDDFYVAQEMQALEKAYPSFHFVPVLRTGRDDWTGSNGYVQDVAAAAHPDLRNAYVFACGAPAMIRSARELLVNSNHLSPDKYFFDAFEPSTVAHSGYSDLESIERVAVVVSMPDGAIRSVRCPVGKSLMRALESENIVQAICGGNQSCGTCRITIDRSDAARLPQASGTEKRLLRALPASGPFDRLSCQIAVALEHEGLHVTIPDGAFE